MKLLFATTNEHKMWVARHVCEQFDITVRQHALEMEEIQSEDGETIARHKAQQAYETLKQPVVVSDDSWDIPGLNGFPGPYMKYINHWLGPNDFLRLTQPLQDRRIFLHQILCYQDGVEQHIFTASVEGKILKEVRGKSKYPHFTVTSFDGGTHSAAEINAAGYTAINDLPNAWHPLCEWLSRK